MEHFKQRVLVTGGLGFIGRNLVEGLLSYGTKHITIIDDCSNSSATALDHWAGRVTHIKTSVTDTKWLEHIAKQEIVFHLACKTILECNADAEYDNQVNTQSTLRVLECIKNLNPAERPGFVYTSSACVYGKTPPEAISEEYATLPNNAYGISKLGGELYTLMHARKFGLSTTALRLSNVYGPGQTPSNPYCGVIGIFLDQARKGRPLTVVGDGKQSRDFTYIKDTVDAILLAAQNIDKSSVNGHVFNVSAGTNVSINLLALEIQKQFPEASIKYIPERGIDDIQHRLLNSQKIKDELGWVSETPLHEGLRKTIASGKF